MSRRAPPASSATPPGDRTTNDALRQHDRADDALARVERLAVDFADEVAGAQLALLARHAKRRHLRHDGGARLVREVEAEVAATLVQLHRPLVGVALAADERVHVGVAPPAGLDRALDVARREQRLDALERVVLGVDRVHRWRFASFADGHPLNQPWREVALSS